MKTLYLRKIPENVHSIIKAKAALSEYKGIEAYVTSLLVEDAKKPIVGVDPGTGKDRTARG